MERPLKGKTALVTGGSRGIGRAIAERLAKDGATVALTYNASKSGADEVVATIEKAGGTAFAVHADLVDPAAIPTLFERLDEEFTKRSGSKALDILVNNAGNSGWIGFKDATPDSWDTLIAVYARAPFFIVQAALDRLPNGGRVINISSAAATKPVTAAPVYSMAKAAVNNLTHALASELGPRGITANAVAPGYTRTDGNAAMREDPELVKAVEAEIALGRFGEPSEIAAVVAFLASDEGHWVTGQTLRQAAATSSDRNEKQRRINMSYAIIGFGKIGQALAHAFARKGIEVSVATTRDPESFASDAAAIGPMIIAKTLADAGKADIIFLAVRFESHPDVAKALPTWEGKTIVDVTNAYGVPPAELGGQPSSKVVAKAFNGGRLVKGFNHLGAAVLGQNPAVHAGRRVVFLASDDDAAAEEIGALAEDLGFAPIKLGGLLEGGLLVQARGNSWGHLIFKDLVKFD